MEDEKKEKGHWIGCRTEADYFGEDRKKGKMDRKLASAKDRSKYKKTDRDKVQDKGLSLEDKAHLSRGRVLSIVSKGIIVDCQGEQIVCSLRGVLKKEKSQFKNLVTVGDFVLFEKSSPDEGLIFQVEPRHSTLSRADNLSRRKEQLIAANIDQVLITVSVVSPPLKPFLVDRYIIAALKGNMKPIIIVNKMDLLNLDVESDEGNLYEEFLKAYQATDIPVIPVSSTSKEGLNLLADVMKDKASVFSGQSGVGKSSLIQAITGIELAIGGIVEKTQKGSHTTSSASLLPLSFGGWCIDTPGIKSFGVWDLKLEEIEPYFTEIATYGKECKYPNCTHTHETDCAVQLALDKGEISLLRYQSYLYLRNSVDSEHLRR